MYILVDIDTRRILALRVTDEKIGDSPIGAELLAEAVEFLDGAAAAGPGQHDPDADAAAADAAIAAMCRATEDATAARLARDRSPVRVQAASVSAGVAAAAAAAAATGRVIYADSAYASRLNLRLCRVRNHAVHQDEEECDNGGRGPRRRMGYVREGAAWPRRQERLRSDRGGEGRRLGGGEWKENGMSGKRRMVEIILSAFKRLWKRRPGVEMGEHSPGDQTKGVGLQHADQCGMGDTGRGRTGGSCTASGLATAAIRRFLCHICLLIT